MELLSRFSSISSYVNNGFCTFRRMLLVIALFLGLSILTLLFQYYLTRGDFLTYTSLPFKRSTSSSAAARPPSTSESNGSTSPTSSNSKRCWQNEEYVVLEECAACSQFEIAAGIRPCKPSGYYDKINCTQSGVTYRSCPRVRWIDERNFIAFMITAALCAITFTFLAHLRQRALDRAMLEKLQRQLGEGM